MKVQESEIRWNGHTQRRGGGRTTLGKELKTCQSKVWRQGGRELKENCWMKGEALDRHLWSRRINTFSMRSDKKQRRRKRRSFGFLRNTHMYCSVLII